MSSIAIEDGLRVAVLLPCQNQAGTIGALIRGFAQELPAARIYVFDNNSTDDTARVATREGRNRPPRDRARARAMSCGACSPTLTPTSMCSPNRAGGYDPADGSSLVNALITERVDMVVGIRRDKGSKDDDPRHQPAGDNAFRWLYHRLFGGGVSDIGSGFRAMSRRFVKSFPAISKGFDIEVELSMHASQLMVPVAEITLEDTPPVGAMAVAPAGPGEAPPRGQSGRSASPRCAAVHLLLFLGSDLLGLGLMLLAPRLLSGEGFSMSSALLGLVMLIAGFISASCGLILDALRRSRIEQKRILFLTVPALGAP